MTGATASFSQTFTVPGNYRYLCTLYGSAADAKAEALRPWPRMSPV
jgi:hypothetical protein